MSLKQFRSLPKVITAVGKWSDKKMPKTGNGFPLSKSRVIRLGGGWHWRIMGLEAAGRECRLLIAFHSAKENYLAALGYVRGSDTEVIGVLEFHGTHPGWHIHGCCKPGRPENVGRMRYTEMVRLPDAKEYHRNTEFRVHEYDALEPAIRHFGLQKAFQNMPSESGTESLFGEGP
ncbi:hypothetical protein [Oxalicibacterium faecigallinarum]|uniref:Uncharacterized protein n=1 Tax=Oxalicibacterium faecigallinarum TaxID=573741 RepID=A0A8J3F4F4_9BURK|nr:hypothetical protein [Oxalicibacterium faecigallinarum]GGI21057.1 hypothetical protein GCM10008066_27160 [Oxalicibacterium faecigallinarum]